MIVSYNLGASLAAAIRPLLDQLKGKSSRNLGANCCDLLDRPALKPLPVTPYVYAEWKQCRAGLNKHFDIERHSYSVPYQLLKKKLCARITTRTVEVYFNRQRVESHAKTLGNHQYSTIRDHMPAHCGFRED